jgi:hypothetical protein
MQTEAKLYWYYDWLAILYGIILRIKQIVIYNEKKRKSFLLELVYYSPACVTRVVETCLVTIILLCCPYIL